MLDRPVRLSELKRAILCVEKNLTSALRSLEAGSRVCRRHIVRRFDEGARLVSTKQSMLDFGVTFLHFYRCLLANWLGGMRVSMR